jgi:hypothetical protein
VARMIPGGGRTNPLLRNAKAVQRCSHKKIAFRSAKSAAWSRSYRVKIVSGPRCPFFSRGAKSFVSLVNSHVRINLSVALKHLPRQKYLGGYTNPGTGLHLSPYRYPGG